MYGLLPLDHPRKGIDKHSFMSNPIRGVECLPFRFMGPYVVKSREDADRVLHLNNMVKGETNDKTNELDPNVFVVRFDHSIEEKKAILYSLIVKNDFVIDLDVIRKAISSDISESFTSEEVEEELKKYQDSILHKKLD